MKNKFYLPLFLIPLLLTGCKKKEETKETPVVDNTINVDLNMTSALTTGKKYKIQCKYNDNFFESSPTTFSKDLMLLSFCANMTSDNKEEADKFYKTIGFDDVSYSESYETGLTTESASFVVAHKHINNFDLISLMFKGTNYKLEWANNFEVGEEGNHAGFEKTMEKTYDFLKNYIETYENNDYKIWVSGFSRGGALANFISHELMTSDDFNVNKENLFTYTFEAPRALSFENSVSYENVFNLVNDADLIPRLLPEEYYLYRCGTDKSIYNDNVSTLLADFDDSLNMNRLWADEDKYSNDIEFAKYAIDALLEDNGSCPYSFKDRAHYYEIETHLFYILDRLFAIPDCFSVIGDKISEIGLSTLLGYLDDDGTKFVNLLKEILDENGQTYDETILEEAGKCIQQVLKSKKSLFYNLKFINNALRMIYMHIQETTWVLINNL